MPGCLNYPLYMISTMNTSCDITTGVLKQDCVIGKLEPGAGIVGAILKGKIEHTPHQSAQLARVDPGQEWYPWK